VEAPLAALVRQAPEDDPSAGTHDAHELVDRGARMVVVRRRAQHVEAHDAVEARGRERQARGLGRREQEPGAAAAPHRVGQQPAAEVHADREPGAAGPALGQRGARAADVERALGPVEAEQAEQPPRQAVKIGRGDPVAGRGDVRVEATQPS
jgi:hypothetical protein